MEIVYDGLIYIRGAPEKLCAEIKEALRLPNPLFWKMKKMGKYIGHLSPYITYYEEDKSKEVLVIPRGVAERLERALRSNGFQVTPRDTRSSGPSCRGADSPWRGRARFDLRDYQDGVIESIVQRDNGIIRCGTGFGKTAIALKLFQTLEVATLIIVPQSHLADQCAAEAERFLGIEATIVGRKGDKIPGALSIATIQWLQHNPDWVREHRRTFGMVLVDECHKSVPKKSRDIIQSFASRYLYGMTATARRTDGQGEALHFIYGDILVDRDLPTATPKVEIVTYEGYIPMGEYPSIIDAQIEDGVRNARIASVVASEVATGRRILVLTKRVSHAEELARLCRGGVGDRADAVALIRGTDAAKARATELALMRSGVHPFRVLVGTTSLLSTGVDLPSLDTLVFAGDLKSDVLTEQSVGRILRLFEGKQDPKILDVVDLGNPILRHQAKERQKMYTARNWQMTEYGGDPK